MSACEHKNVGAHVMTVRDEQEPPHFYVEISANCSDCHIPFSFALPYISHTAGTQLHATATPGAYEENRPVRVPQPAKARPKKNLSIVKKAGAN